jgi:hypothetical protein
MPNRKKPFAAFWITVSLIAVLATYSLNFGPVCWLGCQHDPNRAIALQRQPGTEETRVLVLFVPRIY